jgi:hypothetical protein
MATAMICLHGAKIVGVMNCNKKVLEVSVLGSPLSFWSLPTGPSQSNHTEIWKNILILLWQGKRGK